MSEKSLWKLITISYLIILRKIVINLDILIEKVSPLKEKFSITDIQRKWRIGITKFKMPTQLSPSLKKLNTLSLTLLSDNNEVR